MEYNQPLLKALIEETNQRGSDGVFVWITEYLGWLPYGQYQWLQINDKDILNSFRFEWDYKDLVKLNDLGFATKISEDKYDNNRKEVVTYKLNTRVL
jgi:hypothetical protein